MIKGDCRSLSSDVTKSCKKKNEKTVSFEKLILGGFGILMPQKCQVEIILYLSDFEGRFKAQSVFIVLGCF